MVSIGQRLRFIDDSELEIAIGDVVWIPVGTIATVVNSNSGEGKDVSTGQQYQLVTVSVVLDGVERILEHINYELYLAAES